MSDPHHPLRPTATPGWYPIGDGETRYWDGSTWTAHVASSTPAQHAPSAPPYPAVSVPVYPVMRVSPKSPGLALLGSFFVPGLGQLINGEVAKGILLFGIWCLALLLIIILVGLLIAPVVWLWAMVDAYSSAQRWNARHGIVS